MEIGYIKQRKIIEEMQESYLDYAMSVIVSRALPDIRDGLKPVHRRILYAMWDIGLRASAKYRKSATVVGEVLGKYHPHGDAAVYDSMVRMAQDFSMRYPLVNGQGNFGSVDGDTAAAMRYTEAKLSKISEEMLTDIEKETVDFVDNYDRSQREPSVLPAKLPNALLNGTMGIAVGMATNIPPHNLREIANGIAHLIDNPDATVDDLMEFVKGPDFPTGGLIFSTKDIAQAYYTGRGGIVMRAKADIVEDSKGAFKIVVTELPYQVNKAALIEKIATLVKDKKIEGIKDIRDESDKDGMSVIIELKKDAYPKKVLNRLYTLTQLQDKFHVNLLALVENGLQPRLLNLKTALEHYIQHRETVVVRRTKFELGKAKDRAHILEGLKKALDHIDEIIKTIKKSAHREEAHKNLVKKFKLSDKQAEAILEMKLSQLAALERQKIENELKEKKQLIKELEAILKSPKKIKGLIKSELKELTEKYGDDRRTKVITRGVSEFKQEDLVPNEEVIITLTKSGYIKCLPEKTYKSQGRGGKGVIGMTTKEEDMVMHFLATTTHSDILFFTNRGRVFQLKAYEIPKTTRQAKGQAIVNFLQLAPEEKITALVANESQNPGKYIAMITKNGLAKKVELSDFANVRRSGLIAIKLKKDDELRWAKYTTGDNDILLVTSEGQAIRFAEKDIRAMGRNAAGVRAIRLKKQNDEIVGMDVVDKKPASDAMVLVVTKNGFGKKSKVAQYKKQHRGGSGIKTAKITPKNGKIVTARFIDSTDEEIIIISKKGQTIRIALKSVSEHGRATQGIRIMRLKPGDEVSAIAII